MLKYRMYILALFYMSVIFVAISVLNSRGCYIHPNTDMTMPLLEPEKFYYIGKKFNAVGSLNRGDIVLYSSIHNPDEKLPGRIIGLPGETVEIKDETFYINGKETDCSFGNPVSRRRPNTSVLPLISIPRDILYVLPDNRNNVDFADRRYFVHIYQVQGKFLSSFFSDESY